MENRILRECGYAVSVEGERKRQKGRLERRKKDELKDGERKTEKGRVDVTCLMSHDPANLSGDQTEIEDFRLDNGVLIPSKFTMPVPRWKTAIETAIAEYKNQTGGIETHGPVFG